MKPEKPKDPDDELDEILQPLSDGDSNDDEIRALTDLLSSAWSRLSKKQKVEVLREFRT